MKINICLSIFGVVILLMSCESRYKLTEPKERYETLGQLWYMPNPLDPEHDTILCLRNVERILCTTLDSSYCTFLNKFFSQYDGIIHGCKWHNLTTEHYISFIPDSDIVICPTRDGNFMSIIDSHSSRITDSLILGVERMKPEFTTIYTKLRNDEFYSYSKIYMGDKVSFYGFRRPYISEHSALDTGKIICIDGNSGPVLWEWYIIDQEINH